MVVVATCGVSVCQSVLLISVGEQQQQCLRWTGPHICQAFCLYSPLENSLSSSVDLAAAPLVMPTFLELASALKSGQTFLLGDHDPGSQKEPRTGAHTVVFDWWCKEMFQVSQNVAEAFISTIHKSLKAYFQNGLTPRNSFSSKRQNKTVCTRINKKIKHLKWTLIWS